MTRGFSNVVFMFYDLIIWPRHIVFIHTHTEEDLRVGQLLIGDQVSFLNAQHTVVLEIIKIKIKQLLKSMNLY